MSQAAQTLVQLVQPMIAEPQGTHVPPMFSRPGSHIQTPEFKKSGFWQLVQVVLDVQVRQALVRALEQVTQVPELL